MSRQELGQLTVSAIEFEHRVQEAKENLNREKELVTSLESEKADPFFYEFSASFVRFAGQS